MIVADPIATPHGLMQRVLPLFKWPRKDGLATFLRDRMDLRKSLALCHACEQKMPRRWTERYDYALCQGYHMDGTPCDYCRDPDVPTNLYVAGEGRYWQEWKASHDAVKSIRARERALREKDWRYVVAG